MYSKLAKNAFLLLALLIYTILFFYPLNYFSDILAECLMRRLVIHSVEKDAWSVTYSLMHLLMIKDVWQTVSWLWCNLQAFSLWKENDNISNSKKATWCLCFPNRTASWLTLKGHRKWHNNSACINSLLSQGKNLKQIGSTVEEYKNCYWALENYMLSQLLIIGSVPFVLIPEMCISRTLYYTHPVSIYGQPNYMLFVCRKSGWTK